MLQPLGFGPDEIDRVSTIIRKEHLSSDPQVQTHEDAICLVFLQTQLSPVTLDLGEEATAEVLRKTMRKMSPAGIAAAAGLRIDEPGRSVFDRVMADGDRTAR